jgi:hypothetical protein
MAPSNSAKDCETGRAIELLPLPELCSSSWHSLTGSCLIRTTSRRAEWTPLGTPYSTAR